MPPVKIFLSSPHLGRTFGASRRRRFPGPLFVSTPAQWAWNERCAQRTPDVPRTTITTRHRRRRATFRRRATARGTRSVPLIARYLALTPQLSCAMPALDRKHACQHHHNTVGSGRFCQQHPAGMKSTSVGWFWLLRRVSPVACAAPMPLRPVFSPRTSG
jgi:hypothetical protein